MRPETVSLRAMTANEFAAYRDAFIRDWAADLQKVHDLTSDGALAEAAARTDADLPHGPATPGHHLFAIRAGEERVGTVWFSIDAHGRAFLDDVTIDEASRGKGYGRRALELCEQEAARRGVSSIELHVYRHNPRAIALYEALGYRTTGLKMGKRIAP
jgi:ribosomal protein S18 acetylase RimI-like enzyme